MDDRAQKYAGARVTGGTVGTAEKLGPSVESQKHLLSHARV